MATQTVNVGGGSSVGGSQQVNAFPDEKRIRELAELIRSRLSHAHQLKLAITQQQHPTTAATMQISQAEEIRKRLQESIVKLQERVRDVSLAGIQEWLSTVAERFSLKIDLQRSQQLPGTSVFLIHEGFYIEICFKDNDTLTSVKLSQANTTQEESVELARLLVKRDFVKFESHLKSLVQFYNQAVSNVNCEPAHMYRALHAMEAVLITINEYSPQASVTQVIMENPLGHVSRRHGGLPMKLTFFVYPHEIMKNALSSLEMGVSVGVAGKITMEKSSTMYMLSTDPNLYDISTATFFLVTARNSSMLPLTFVFELSEPLAVCSLVRDELQKVCGTEQSLPQVGNIHINQLIARRKSEKEGKDLVTEKWRLVCLPEQYHYYLMPDELRSTDALPDQIVSPQFCGALVTKVPFLHPGKIFIIIMLLRKQLVYNALISSCLGRSRKSVPPPTSSEVTECIFEVSSSPPNLVTVAMDLQNEKSMIVDFIVPDQNPTAVEVRIKMSMDASFVHHKLLSEIAQRCLSIPVTLRAALKHPARLVDSKLALELQKYYKSLVDFDKAIHCHDSKDQGTYVVGGAAMDVGDHVTLLGQ